MPVYTDALLGDTTHLTAEEFGAYCLLLFATWRNNGRPFDDEDARLSRICRVSLGRWKKHLRPCLAQFFYLKGGKWRQKRLEKEWKYVSELREKKSAAGKASAAAKRLKENETVLTSVITDVVTHTPTNGATPPQQNANPQTHSKDTKKDLNQDLSSDPVLRRFATPQAALDPRGKIKEQLRSKLMRYCNSRLPDEKRSAAIRGLMGEDPEHDAQWWLDAVDKRRRREGWDDTSEWKRQNLGAR